MTSSNLSKIKPKLRTTGRVSGNFGKSKIKAGSPLSDIGMTKVDVIHIATQDEYLSRLYEAHSKTNDAKLKTFIEEQIKKIQVQRSSRKG
jgi:hypothetical protein